MQIAISRMRADADAALWQAPPCGLMMSASPAWKPRAMFAEVTGSIIAASLPFHGQKLSPGREVEIDCCHDGCPLLVNGALAGNRCRRPGYHVPASTALTAWPATMAFLSASDVEIEILNSRVAGQSRVRSKSGEFARFRLRLHSRMPIAPEPGPDARSGSAPL